MELKLKTVDPVTRLLSTFNRTSMELKQIITTKGDRKCIF